jgi:hypothetical protein
MDYNRLEQIFKSELPINRKERFYTGTVLPALLFHCGLSNFYSFLREIPGFPSEVEEKKTQDEFLLYTEYNLKESAVNNSVGTEIYTDTRDTPDLIIEILKPVKMFIVIEAKMFASPSQSDFEGQMKAQKKAVIDVLKKKYSESKIFHVALVPKGLGLKSTSDFDVLNWEYFIDKQDLNVRDNYFYPYLKFALMNYEMLRSKKWATASTILEKITGNRIYKDSKAGKVFWVGRSGGIKAVEEDVKKGVWKRKLYGTNTVKPKDGRAGNWLTSTTFVQIIDNKLL